MTYYAVYYYILCHHDISCIMNTSQATSLWENQGCPIHCSFVLRTEIPCILVHIVRQLPRSIDVIVCSPKITVQILQDLAYISVHSTWVVLFGFVNWLCLLLAGYFMFTLHTLELILFLLDLPPVKYAYRHCCDLTCRCAASSSFHALDNGQQAGWMEWGTTFYTWHGQDLV